MVSTDNQSVMKRVIPSFLLFILASSLLSSYPVIFKEQFYQLYHIHSIQYPDDSIENIYWLENARKADFCNPLHALATIGDKKQWERYRYLFNMHIELKLIEQHLILGSKFDKRTAFFYNAPWKDQNLESLALAESAYKAALAYWPSAKEWALKAMSLPFVKITGQQAWLNEAFRISSGDLDYADIIADELTRVYRVRKEFEAMGITY